MAKMNGEPLQAKLLKLFLPLPNLDMLSLRLKWAGTWGKGIRMLLFQFS